MKYDVNSLEQELRVAKKNTADHMPAYKALVARLVGPFYGAKAAGFDPENTSYEWVTSILPQLVFENPRWQFRSKRGGKYQEQALGIERAMNRYNVDEDFQGFLVDGPVNDMQFCYGVSCTTMEDYDGERYDPFEEGDDAISTLRVPKNWRIAPGDFVWDPVAKSRRDAMYEGHRTIWDKDELLERAKAEDGWNLEVLQSVVDNLTHDDKQSEMRKRDGLSRDEIVIWELWFPKWQQEGKSRRDGFNGSIVTLLDSAYNSAKDNAKGEFPRKTRAFWGHRSGPYEVFGALKVPEEYVPLSPLTAVEGQVRELNTESRGLTRGGDSFKRFVVGSDKKLTEAIKKGKHDHVHYQADFAKDKMSEFAIGGITAEQMSSFEFRRDRVDHSLGLSQTRAGNARSGVTATADAIADAGSDRRISLIRQACERSIHRIGVKLAWYFHNSNDLATLIGTTEQGEEMWFRGGPVKKPDGSEDKFDTFDAYELEIQDFSMERISEATQQAQAVFLTQVWPQALLVMPQAPQNDWALWAKLVGQRLHMPEIEELLNPQILQGMTGMALQAAQPAPEPPRMMAKPNAPPPGMPARPANTRTAAPSSQRPGSPKPQNAHA